MLELVFLLLPVAAAYGWYMGHRSVQQSRQQEADRLSKDYLAGMNLLLNNQQDKAVDLFLDMLKEDSSTADAHLTLGSLFRSRGEVDRAIRVHQALLESASISYEQRLLAAAQLGRDYMAAGLYDRAETLFQQLTDESDFRQAALRQLSQIYQATSEWQKAIEVTQRLVRLSGEGLPGEDLQAEVAHFYCELALQAMRDDDLDKALALLKKASGADANSARSAIMLGRIFMAREDYASARAQLEKVPHQDSALICETLEMLQVCYQRQQDAQGWYDFLSACVAQDAGASAELLLAQALEQREGTESARRYLIERLQRHPTMRVFHRLIDYHILQAQSGRAKESLVLLRDVVGRQIQSRPHYCCQKCGLACANLYWHCPSCRAWSSIKPIRGLDGHQ